jgi:hypothetical protein
MFGFIFLGALQDSQMAPGQKKPRVKLGYADVFCFSVYLAVAFPIPQIMSYFLGSAVGEDGGLMNWGCEDGWASSHCSGHRWYLFMIVYSHVCCAIGQMLGMPGWLQGIGHLALASFGPNEYWDICDSKFGLPKWVKWVACWVFPYANGASLPDGSYMATCPVFYDWIEWYVLFYVLAFYYSRPGMKWITGLIERAGLNSPAWAMAAFGCASLIGAANAAFHYPNQILETGISGDGFRWWFIPLEFGVNTVQPLLVALSMAWFPFNLKYWGNSTLGNYCVHFYFMIWMVPTLRSILIWMGGHGLQGVPQVVAMLAIPFAFMSTFGALFHYALLTPGFALQHAQKWLRSRKSLASRNYSLSEPLLKRDPDAKDESTSDGASSSGESSL